MRFFAWLRALFAIREPHRTQLCALLAKHVPAPPQRTALKAVTVPKVTTIDAWKEQYDRRQAS